jgi:hypothetical protein
VIAPVLLIEIARFWVVEVKTPKSIFCGDAVMTLSMLDIVRDGDKAAPVNPFPVTPPLLL